VKRRSYEEWYRAQWPRRNRQVCCSAVAQIDDRSASFGLRLGLPLLLLLLFMLSVVVVVPLSPSFMYFFDLQGSTPCIRCFAPFHPPACPVLWNENQVGIGLIPPPPPPPVVDLKKNMLTAVPIQVRAGFWLTFLGLLSKHLWDVSPLGLSVFSYLNIM